jgi:predicted phage terminase large subunit-like protein
MSKINLDQYIQELEETSEDEQLKADMEYQKKIFLEYVSAGSNFPDERKKLLEDFNKGLALTGKKGLRRRLGAFDLGYFARAYLPHYFTRKSPKFHEELDHIWSNGVLKDLNPHMSPKEINHLAGRFRGVAAPRGHAKSTNVTFKDPLHATLYEYKHYALILSDSSDQAEGFLSDIKIELEDNEAIKEDFGSLKGNKVWKNSVIVTSTNVKIEAIGSGKKIRGRRHRNWRPDLIVLDDVENDENVNTKEQRKKLENWFYKAVSKAGDTYTDIFYVGTVLHYDSLLMKVLRNPKYKSLTYQGVISWATNRDLWDVWESIYIDLTNDNRQEDALQFFEDHKEEMLEGTKVLWEEKLSYYDLMVLRISEGIAAFNSEIQNDPVDPSMRTFNEEWLDFYDDAGQPFIDFKDSRFVIVGALDPSLAKNDKSDTNANIAIFKDTVSGYMYVVEAIVEKRKPNVIIDDTIEQSKRMKRDYNKPFHVFGVETIQFQYFFKDVLEEKCRLASEHLPIEELNPRQQKDLRISSLAPLIKNKYIKFSRKHKTLIDQIINHPKGKDDGPDALEQAVRLALKIKGSTKVEYKSVLSRMVKFRRGAY